MSYSVSTLLTRNLHDVFGENDPARRRAAIAEIFTEDCVFYEPRGVYRGRDEIDRVAGAIKATHPDFRHQRIAGPEELGNGGRILPVFFIEHHSKRRVKWVQPESREIVAQLLNARIVTDCGVRKRAAAMWFSGIFANFAAHMINAFGLFRKNRHMLRLR